MSTKSKTQRIETQRNKTRTLAKLYGASNHILSDAMDRFHLGDDEVRKDPAGARKRLQAHFRRSAEVRAALTPGLQQELGRSLSFLLRNAPESSLDRTVWTETPKRWTAALGEMTAGYTVDIPSLFKTFEKAGYKGMVVLGPVKFYSLCEHHLLPFHGDAYVGYLPGKRIVGLSKLARLVEAHARRLQVQERLTQDIAQDIHTHLAPLGVAVRIESVHTCMCARGIRKEGVMRTQSLLGAFHKGDVKAEFNELIRKGS